MSSRRFSIAKILLFTNKLLFIIMLLDWNGNVESLPNMTKKPETKSTISPDGEKTDSMAEAKMNSVG